MTTTIQIKEHTVTAAEIIPLLDNYQMLPQFLRRFIIDCAIANIECTPAEIEDSWVIVRLEKYLPARLDRAMREKLLNELCDRWLDKEVAAIDNSKIQAA